MKIIKRDGAEEDFDNNKIMVAVAEANMATGKNKLSLEQTKDIVDYVEYKCIEFSRAMSVEEIQDMVENQIMSIDAFELVKDYTRYHYQRSLIRKASATDSHILPLIECNNEDVKQKDSSKNPTVNNVQRDYMAGEVGKDLTERMLLPQDTVEAGREGIIHFHDSDHFTQCIHSCDLVDLEDMLQNSVVISETRIEKPYGSSTVCNIATQIIAQVTSDQYGGQNISLAHLALFVGVSRKRVYAEVQEEVKTFGYMPSEETIHEVVENRLRKGVTKDVQTIQYQVITLMTTDGQAPFLIVFVYLNEAKNEREKKGLIMIIEETLKQYCQGMKNESGVWITPAFSKLIYALEGDNVNEGAGYYYLTETAAKCTAKRLVPDYISEKKTMELKEGNYLPVMGCHSTLSPQKDESGNCKFYGHFNQGVVTINLVDVVLSSGGGMRVFWEIFSERPDLYYRILMCRHNRLRGTLSDAVPILWQNGALARPEKGEIIDRFLYGGYSIISLGYAGLYECVRCMIGKFHTDQETTPLALEVMEYINKACNRRKDEANVGSSIYELLTESATYKFARCPRKRFSIIEDMADRSYITNSYHVNISEKIGVSPKLKFESQFQALSTGGAISYVKVSNMQNNTSAMLGIIRYIHDSIMYAKLNTKSDFCQECGFDGEIQIVTDESDKLVWGCPKCGNWDKNELNVARGTCGYIGTQFQSQGRAQETKERVLRL